MPVRNKESLRSKNSKSKTKNGRPSLLKTPTNFLPIVTRSMSRSYRDWLESNFGNSRACTLHNLGMYAPTNIVTRSVSRGLAAPSGSQSKQFISETSQHFSQMDHYKEAVGAIEGRLSDKNNENGMHPPLMVNTPYQIPSVTEIESNDSESMIIDEDSHEKGDSERRGWFGKNVCPNLKQLSGTQQNVTSPFLETTDQKLLIGHQNHITTCMRHSKCDANVQTDRLDGTEQQLTFNVKKGFDHSSEEMKEELPNVETSGIESQFEKPLTETYYQEVKSSAQLNNTAILDRKATSITQDSVWVTNALSIDKSCPSIYSHHVLADFDDSRLTQTFTENDQPITKQHQMDVEAALAHLRDVWRNKDVPGLELSKFKRYQS